MIQSARKPILNILRHPAAPLTAALLAVVAYFLQAWHAAHFQFSVLDEGAYLYKGFLLVSGQTQLYADYGFWSNHMPLSFYIPGWVQAAFGWGLRSVRYASLVWAGLLLLGLWLTVNRLSNRWWAAGVLWAVALNGAILKTYSMGLTQVIISCMLVWVLYLTLGAARKPWQLFLGTGLTGILVLTRINLVPLTALLVLYLWWQYGFRTALWAGLILGTVLLIGHALFFPGILRMWSYWLPESITPFLNAFRPPAGAEGLWDERNTYDFLSRLYALFYALRYNLLPLLAALLVWCFFPRPGQWQEKAVYRSAVFLSVGYAFLFLLHAWVSVGGSHCVYCLKVYLTFFELLALVLLPAAFTHLDRKPAPWRTGLFVTFFTLSFGSAVFITWQDSLSPRLIRRTLNRELPRWLLGDFSGGKVVLEAVLRNKLGLADMAATQEWAMALARGGLAVALGLAASLLAVALAWLVWRLWSKKQASGQHNAGWVVALALLGLVFLLTPTVLLSGGYADYDTGVDMIARNEKIGALLDEVLPAGAQVYWRGGNSITPLLYVPDVIPYLPQINGTYSFYVTGDTDGLERFGFWNEELAQRWQAEADYLLLEERYYDTSWEETGRWVEVLVTPLVNPDVENSSIYVLERVE